MKQALSIGMIGLDSSRSMAFAQLLQEDGGFNSCETEHVMACPNPLGNGGQDAERSQEHARQLVNRWGVELVDSPEEVASRCDLLLLLSADVNARAASFDMVVDSAKPMYLEKSLAETASAAQQMVDRAARSGGRLFSASSVRFSPGWRRIMEAVQGGDPILGIDLVGPLPAHETLSRPHWYGVHQVDLAIDALGIGWSGLERFETDDGETTIVLWPDGRVATIRGPYDRSAHFTATIRRPNDVKLYDLAYSPEVCNRELLKATIHALTADKQDSGEYDRMVESVRLTEAMAESISPLHQDVV